MCGTRSSHFFSGEGLLKFLSPSRTNRAVAVLIQPKWQWIRLHISTCFSSLHIIPEDSQTKGSESSHTIRKYLWCSIKVSLRLRDYLVFRIPRQRDVIEHSLPPNLLVANTVVNLLSVFLFLPCFESWHEVCSLLRKLGVLFLLRWIRYTQTNPRRWTMKALTP